MDSSKIIVDKLIAIATKRIAKVTQERIVTEATEHGEPDADKITDILRWAQAEVRRLVSEANAISEDETISPEQRQREIFKIMLGDMYDDYVRRFEKETGKKW